MTAPTFDELMSRMREEFDQSIAPHIPAEVSPEIRTFLLNVYGMGYGSGYCVGVAAAVDEYKEAGTKVALAVSTMHRTGVAKG